MQLFSHYLRILFGLAFTLMLAPVVGEFFVELAKEHKVYDQPTERVGAIFSAFSSITNAIWFWYAFMFVAGLALGSWLDWLARRLGRKSPEQGTATTLLLPPFNTQKVVVRDQAFRFEVVVIDGKSFNRCDFDHVTLRYEGAGAFDFIECKFSLPIQFDFGDDRLRAVSNLFQLALQTGMPINFPDELPATNAPPSPQSPSRLTA